MAIEKYTEENKMTIRAGGRLDAVTSPELGEILQAIPADLTELVFDLSGLEYISSAGLRVFLMAHHKLGKDSVVIANVSEAVRDIFDTTGFSDIFLVEQ